MTTTSVCKTLSQMWQRAETLCRNVRSKFRYSFGLQFILGIAVCCVLHRPMSRVIHRTELLIFFTIVNSDLRCQCKSTGGTKIGSSHSSLSGKELSYQNRGLHPALAVYIEKRLQHKFPTTTSTSTAHHATPGCAAVLKLEKSRQLRHQYSQQYASSMTLLKQPTMPSHFC